MQKQSLRGAEAESKCLSHLSSSQTTCLSRQGLSKWEFLPLLLLSHRHIPTEHAFCFCVITGMHKVSRRSVTFWVGYLTDDVFVEFFRVHFYRAQWNVSLAPRKCDQRIHPVGSSEPQGSLCSEGKLKAKKLGGVLPISFGEDGSRVRGSLHGGQEKDHKAMSSLLKMYKFCFYHFFMILLTS